MAKRLVAVDDSDNLFPTPVQNAYLGQVDQRIQTAVQNFNGVAQAVADKVAPLTADGQVAPLIDSATNLRNKLDARYFYAPVPSGGDDTTILNQLINAAQATRGTVRLREGQYIANIATAQSFSQPVIIGAGKRQTFIKPADRNKATIRMQGGSGGHSGGFISDLTLNNDSATTATAALEIADACDIHWERLGIEGNYADGIRFRVTQSSGFCEFNNGVASIESSVSTAIHYVTSNTYQTSFHGTGLTGGIVNTNTGPAVLIDNYTFPYNAPMDATFFTHTASATVIRNNYTTIKPGFTGTFRIENQTGGVTIAADPDAGQVLFIGPVVINTANTYLGKLYQAKKVYWKANTTIVQYEPWQRYVQLGSAPTLLELFLQNGETALVSINIKATNYNAHYELMVWQNPYNPGGDVTVLSGRVYTNGTGIGDINFSLQNYQLVIANGAMTGDYYANVSISHLGGNIDPDNARQ